MIKYEVNNQLTGISEEALSFEEAKLLRKRIINDYILQVVESLFHITVLVQNEDKSWTQALADENGEPIIYTDDFDFSFPLDEKSAVNFLPRINS
jgi:hypothetical protein